MRCVTFFQSIIFEFQGFLGENAGVIAHKFHYAQLSAGSIAQPPPCGFVRLHNAE